MKVILKQDIEKLGKIGDIVKIAPGYGRNYLIPKKFAVLATPGNVKTVEIERLALAKRDQRDKDAASLLAQELVKITVSVKRKTGEEGALYGSVTALDIAEFLAARQIEIDKRKIQLDEPIKAIGEFQVPIRLHREVTVPIKVVVESEASAEAVVEVVEAAEA
ncbi:MAG: 50S ribosomal protein L9 [Acidobacteriota bacterium]|jgi:large subunit ribosomal protein L9|nr:50S ribosomal protein L9 [Acidobacteriota bacterium]